MTDEEIERNFGVEEMEFTEDTIEWRLVHGYDYEYEVNNHSIVRVGQKILSQYNRGIGYKSVSLVKNGKRVFIASHRLSAIAFIDNPENKPCVNHLNSVRDDNRIENLEWVTHKENIQHMILSGRQVIPNRKGEKAPRYKDGQTAIYDKWRLCATCGNPYRGKVFKQLHCGRSCAAKSRKMGKYKPRTKPTIRRKKDKVI